jgi:hypothetical protein
VKEQSRSRNDDNLHQVCLRFIQNYEQKHGKLDFVIKTRPDLLYLRKLNPPNDWPREKVSINPRFNGELDDDFPLSFLDPNTRSWSERLSNESLFTDIFAIIPRHFLDKYLFIHQKMQYSNSVSAYNINADSIESKNLDYLVKQYLNENSIPWTIYPIMFRIRESVHVCRIEHMKNQFLFFC